MLPTLPKTLDETYERILFHIEENGQLEDAIRILPCLCFPTCPLHRVELAEILAIKLGPRCGFLPEERLPDPQDIMAICSSLIARTRIRSWRKDKLQASSKFG